MKVKIKPYLLRLLKSNIAYILSLLLLIILFFVILSISIDKIKKEDKKISTLTAEVDRLEKKANFFQDTLPSSKELDEDIKLLNNLIPNIEDYFSIVYALETISQKTGFNIESYSVNITKSTPNKLRLSVNGIGDSTTFLKFLNEYNFSGGRLITSDKIELSPQLTGAIKVDLTFYNKNVPLSGSFDLPKNDKIFAELDSIKKKVSFEFIEKDQETLDLNYPIKKNPF
jgi:hypothetical protein